MEYLYLSTYKNRNGDNLHNLSKFSSDQDLDNNPFKQKKKFIYNKR